MNPAQLTEQPKENPVAEVKKCYEFIQGALA